MIRWAVLTGEYPPEAGGVADYTRLVARGLADAGDAVHVYAPHRPAADPGIETHGLPDHYGPRSLADLERELTARPPHRILVQYVPHAFGSKAMNLPFAAWLALRGRRIAPLWVMFHEVAFPFSWRPMKHALLGSVTRIMARLVAGAAERVFVTIPAWANLLKRFCPRVRPPQWLPVPCTLPPGRDPQARVTIRRHYAGRRAEGGGPPGGGLLVGHFGTYAPHIADLLAPAIDTLSRLVPEAGFLFVGRESDRFREGLLRRYPDLVGRVHATGAVPADEVSDHLRACDLLLQPFADGVSSRRTSVMAGLANGVPVVTNLGPLSEPLWSAGAVAVVPTADPQALARLAAGLLADPPARSAFGRRGAELYHQTFSLEHTVARLRETK